MAPGALTVVNKTGIEFLMQAGAGCASGFRDSEDADKKVRFVAGREEVFAASDMVIQVRCLGANPEVGRNDLPLMRAGQTLIGFSEPLTAIEQARELASLGVSHLAMELMPRI